jgi:hypothetical protein
MTIYKVLGNSFLDWEKGDEFEHEFTEDEELDSLKGGQIEVVPSEYVVVGPSEVYGAKTGETFTGALPAYQVRQLVEGGHIEPAPPQAEKPARDLIAEVETTTDLAELGRIRAAEEARGDKSRATVIAAIDKREDELPAPGEEETGG